ncbi:MAG TPA: sensor histidine kinase [Actinomycetes bacterium]
MTAQTADLSPVPGFSHEAFMYSEPAGFLEQSISFIREGVELGEAVLVAVPGQRAAWLRNFFADEPGVRVEDMAEMGANPARIIPAWREFLDRHTALGRPVRGIGEPIWADRSPAELAECQLHESLLNLAFGDGPAWRLLCPYDVSSLAGGVLDQALATHPVVVDADGRSASNSYHSVPPSRALRGHPLPPPAGASVELPITNGELGSVRRLVRRQCTEVGLDEERSDDLTLAVDEVAGNSLLHGGGIGLLRVWTEPSVIVCEVTDSGVIANPLVGRQRPSLERINGRGLWLANQLCDLVQVRSGAAGTIIRLHMRLP